MNKFVSSGEIQEEFINDSVQFIPLGYIQGSVVVMVVVNCNYAVMDYLLYLIVSNFG